MTKDDQIKSDIKFSGEDMDHILSEYSVFRKLLDMDLYNKQYFGNAEILLKKENATALASSESSRITSKMFFIRRFVLSLGGCNEKLFLFYHYIHGESVGRVAELMGISRRSAFRLKKRALEFAAYRYPIYLEKTGKIIDD